MAYHHRELRGTFGMSMLVYEALEETPLAAVPFAHVVVPNFIAKPDLARIAADFPSVPGPGSHPPAALAIKGAFAAMMHELESPRFRQTIEKKFAIDLSGHGFMCTVRGELRGSDGSVHTDSKSKLITALLYLNEEWMAAGGRLRLLRSPDSLDDPVVEIPPLGGTLLVFRRSKTSWHGHTPYAGKRRALQINWVDDPATAARELRRHFVSTRIKQLTHRLWPRHSR
jgi:SM-20-related protein